MTTLKNQILKLQRENKRYKEIIEVMTINLNFTRQMLNTSKKDDPLLKRFMLDFIDTTEECLTILNGGE